MSAFALVRLPPAKPSAFVFPLPPSDVQRDLSDFGGRTVERIRFAALFDATDGLERRLPEAVMHGIRPELAALELLLRERKPLLFLWGERKLVVSIDAIGIQESAFDRVLNPIRAIVSVALTVSGGDLFWGAIGAAVDATAATGLAPANSSGSGPVHGSATAPATMRMNPSKGSSPTEKWIADVDKQDAQRRAQLAAYAFVDVEWKQVSGAEQAKVRNRK